MRKGIQGILAAAIFVFASCGSETPTAEPRKADIDQAKGIEQLGLVDRCSMHLSPFGNGVLGGDDMKQAVALLKHCLLIPSNKTFEDALSENDISFPCYTLYFWSSESGESEMTYGITHFGDGSRVIYVWGKTCGGKAFIADAATLKMANELVETARKAIERDRARKPGPG
jgi:hypothetical protein